MYSDADAAALYDLLNGWGPSDDFYLGLVMKADSALDVGCGTGGLLHRARVDGHDGRLVGIDPDLASLDRARVRADIEWVAGTAASMSWDREFDLAVMASHAFQVFITDDDLRASLKAIQAALRDGGCFAFETRNPLVREWEKWNPTNPSDLVDPAGRAIRVLYEVESVVGDVVTLTETTATPDNQPLRVDRSSLRFLAAQALDAFLTEAGFAVEARYGDWTRGPFTDASSTIITVARKL
jgi:SAM-dependent methyltransferase